MNKKTILISALICFLLFSFIITYKSKSLISKQIVGVETTFLIKKTESVVPLDSIIYSDYKNTCQLVDEYLSLNKIVEGSNYKLYVSMGTAPVSYIKEVSKRAFNILGESNKPINYQKTLSLLLKKDSLMYIARTIYFEKNEKNVIIFDLASKDSLFIQKAFRESFIEEYIGK